MSIVTGNFNDMKWMPVLEKDGVTHRCRKIMFGAERATVQIGEFCNGHAIKPHSHEYEQIAIILQGVCDFVVDDVPYRMTAGSYIVLPPRSVHYIHVYDSPVPVMNMDIFIPARPEYTEKYKNFIETGADHVISNK